MIEIGERSGSRQSAAEQISSRYCVGLMAAKEEVVFMSLDATSLTCPTC